MIWSPATSRRSQPTASERACSSEWGMSSPFPASLAIGWRAHPASPASGGDGVCGVRLCQGVLVGGHVLSFCLVGYAVLDWFGGQGWVASPGMASFSSQGGWCRDGGGEGAGMSFELCVWGREGQAERLHFLPGVGAHQTHSRQGRARQWKPCVSAAHPQCCGWAPVIVQVKESRAVGVASSLSG